MRNIFIVLTLGLLAAGCTLDRGTIDAACEVPCTAYIYDGGRVAASNTIAADSPLAAEIHNWLNANSDGWHVSYNTFTPNIVVHNTNMSLNITAKYAVLNVRNPSSGKWQQFIKAINIADIEFLNQIRAEQGDPGHRRQIVPQPER